MKQIVAGIRREPELGKQSQNRAFRGRTLHQVDGMRCVIRRVRYLNVWNRDRNTDELVVIEVKELLTAFHLPMDTTVG